MKANIGSSCSGKHFPIEPTEILTTAVFSVVHEFTATAL
jgi:hypothetical protein